MCAGGVCDLFLGFIMVSVVLYACLPSPLGVVSGVCTGFDGCAYMVLTPGFVWNISGLGLCSLIFRMRESSGIWDSKRSLESLRRTFN